MRIKLAILDNDRIYLNRIVSVLNSNYAEKVEVYSFTDAEVAIKTIEDVNIDVIIAAEGCDINADLIPKRCALLYFSENQGIDKINEVRAVCKYQKIDIIYKEILDTYYENNTNITGIKFGDKTSKVISFMSVGGGVGTSTMAVACSKYLAGAGKRVLYLNLEPFGNTNKFFYAEGQYNFGDILYAIKSKKQNLSIKLESSVKQDTSGVFFYESTKTALDLLEMSGEELEIIMDEIQKSGLYDYIVIDCALTFEEKNEKIMKQSSNIIFVSDGNEICNEKITRAYEALHIKQQNNEYGIIYNKFRNKTSQVMELSGVTNLGGAPMYENASNMQVQEELHKMNIFSTLLQ